MANWTKITLTLILLLMITALAGASWKFNPYTGKMDYYESGFSGLWSDLTGTPTILSAVTSTPNAVGVIIGTTSAMTGTDRSIVDFVTGGSTTVFRVQVNSDGSAVLKAVPGGTTGYMIMEIPGASGKFLISVPTSTYMFGIVPVASAFITTKTGVGTLLRFSDGSTSNFLELRLEGTGLLNDLAYSTANTFSFGKTTSPIKNIYHGDDGTLFQGTGQDSKDYYDGNNRIQRPNAVARSNGGRLIVSGNVILADINSLGSDITNNGTFTGGCAEWTLASGWTCTTSGSTEGLFHTSNGTGTAAQSVTGAVVGDAYLVSYTTTTAFSGSTGGTVKLTIDGVDFDTKTQSTSLVGTNTYSFIASSETFTVSFTPSIVARFGIDVISIKPLGKSVNMYVGGTAIATAMTTTTLKLSGAYAAGAMPCYKTDGTIGYCDWTTECATTCN